MHSFEDLECYRLARELRIGCRLLVAELLSC